MIFALSSIPGGRTPSVPVPGADSAVHFALYLGLGFLVWRARGPARARAGGGRRAFEVGLATSLCVLYGSLDELHQLLVPARTFEVADLVADAAGAFAGAEIGRHLEARRLRAEARAAAAPGPAVD
jgi:VanZ family protein